MPKRVIIGASLMTLPAWAFLQPKATDAPAFSPAVQSHVTHPDPRVQRLRAFFRGLHSPATDFADDFVRAADQNHLDWRLLPSISVIESGGGKQARNNNIFGWANGNKAFESIRAGIQEVAYKLAHSPSYRGHDSAGKLKVYNPDSRYASNVMLVMDRIAPSAPARFGFAAN